MTDFNKRIADSNHALKMRRERKRREFWQEVEFYVTEAFFGILAIALIVFAVWWTVAQ